MVKNSTAHRPTRRGTVLLQSTKTSELISAEALQHVVLPKKKDRQEDKEIEREDPIGDQMTKILNLHPGFCYDPAASSPHHASGEDEGFTISPILCRHNWKHLKHVFQRVKSIGLPTLVLSIIGFCCERSPSRQKFRETLQSSLLLFFALLVLGLSSILAMTHITTMWLGKETVLFVIQLLLILVDWNEMEKTCPPMIKSCIRGLTNLARCVDQYLLFGKRFAGREWNGEDFEFENPMGAQSRHADLWTLPPPCIKEAGQKMCLDLRYMKRDEWGQDTTKHLVAINFSYVMMREEHIRKRAGRSTIFHQQRSTSMALVPEGEWGPGRNDHTEENNTDLPHARVVPTSEKLDIINAMDRNSNNSPTAEGIELVHDDDEETLPEYQLDQLKSFATMIEDDNDVSCLLSPTGANDKSDNISITSSVGSCSSAAVADMNWVDISAKIGMRVLNSAHLQRVVASQEAAERLKNITEQFVVSPKENARKRNQTMDFAGASSMRSPGEISTVGPSSTVNKVIQDLPKSPCRPVHSMWTSAAAAGANSEDEQSNESTSEESAPGQAAKLLSEPEYLPSTPPKIIRTQKFPTTETSKSKEFTSVSPLRDAEDPGLERNQAAKPTTRKPVKCDLICEPSTMTDQSEQAYEVIGTAVDSTYDIPDEDKVFEDTKQEEAPRRTTPIEKKLHRRAPLAPGVKVAAPMCPLQPGRRKVGKTNYQMATVVSSERVWVDSGSDPHADGESTNCLSVTCKVDKSFLRNGDFMELTFRVLDEWSARYMPKHSKVPIGSCVATSYGVGVVVGWRVEDDCHVVRSLWQRRGPGAAHAYLTRDAIHCVLEAAIGFVVDTKLGPAKVLAYVDAGPDFQNGRYIITLQDDEVYRGCVFALKRDDIYSCHGAQFMPVTEYIKEACHYQIMLDNYKALVRQQKFSAEENRKVDDHLWKFWSENLDILWQSFLKATSEDREFDEEIDSFMGSIIDFLERLDRPSSCATKDSHVAKEDRCDMSVSKSLASIQSDCDDVSTVAHSAASELQDEEHVAGFWILDDILGGVFQTQKAKPKPSTEENILGSIPQENQLVDVDQYDNSESYKRAFAVIRTLMKTVSLARAASVGKPQFRLAMTICREFLMFVKTLIKVQQKNVSKESLRVWKSALEDIVSFFGPIKERLEKIARGIATRMEQQGRRAKIKVLRFADSILLDELFVSAACRGDWEQCLLRIENSMVKAKIIDEASCVHYRKTARFLYEHLVLFSSRESSAAARNNEKLALLAKVVQFFASPKRSFLKVLKSDTVLEILERILIRVFCREKEASRTLMIHASNFKSLRHFRMLKDLSVAGRLWIPLLDAADEEFSYVVARMPENAKEFMCPLSSIFSLCVAQFHKLTAGSMTSHWLDFLMEEDGVRIIHDIDMKLILALSSFSRDVKEMIEVLPYYPSIDDDILDLIDEVKIDMFLKEASDAIDDADKLADFIREKASIAVERFLAYLPKLSIPVERRDLGDGWVLTCNGVNGGDLTLSDVKIKRKNLVCQVLGGDSLLLPLFDAIDDTDKSVAESVGSNLAGDHEVVERVEESILDHISEMILQAQRHGSWTVGIGGVSHPPTDQYMNSVLHGLQITSVLNCAIELWRNLEIDDDELLEIAIRDVSYQIQLHKEMGEKADEDKRPDQLHVAKSSQSAPQSSVSSSGSFEDTRSRFNPRVDPTVLYLEIKNLTLYLEQFRFRIEKNQKRTVFDPVFEGCGTVLIENVSILFRVECARERIGTTESDLFAPVLVMRELEVDIENVKLKVQDTGADWLLNKAVKGFAEPITQVVAANLKEQVHEQTQKAIEQLNSYFFVNPDILLNILDVTMDDLDELAGYFG